ncbi:hypothetical protein [Nakamurella lactea]|uniref:hypothetical protein n=1 Tax=Nakamurella lactea TaxID=459515 RepID=UPI0006870B02|nr:hypothetical protein [Nakamurella lactea]
MSIVLVGSNPGLLLFDNGTPVAMASVWSVDWSVWGFGTVLMMVDADGWRTVGTDEHLARILLERFNRHFPEAESFDDQAPVRHTDDEVQLTCDLRSGLHAAGGGLELRLGDVRDRRPFAHPAFPLGEIELGLTNVYAPCGFGELMVDGVSVPGQPECSTEGGRWSSTGYLAVAEVWTDPTGALQQADTTEPARRRQARPARRRHLRAINS